MHAGLEMLLLHLKGLDGGAELETVVIGVVEGDIHETGKNPMGLTPVADGRRVIDLGYDADSWTA